MGFRSSHRTENKDTSEVSNRISHQQTAQRESSDSVPEIYNVERGEEYYEMTIPDTDTLQRLHMTEEVHGDHVHDWVAEGMPIEIMGKVRGMEAFRERQAERPSEVPTNIERRNNLSVQRSEKAASETGPAGETGVPEPVRDVISSTGRSLDSSIQRAMEDRMGDSCSDVQIHTGSQAAAACESINARAFTVGNHIAFNAGEYDPKSPEGQHVLAHELAHVRQQTAGAVSMLPQEDVELEVDPDPRLEREAEETAQQVMSGGELGIQCLKDTQIHVQRMRDYVGDASQAVSDYVRQLFGNDTELDESDFENLSSEELAALQEAMDSGGPNIAKALAKALIYGMPTAVAAGPEAGVAVGGIKAAYELAEQSGEHLVQTQLEQIKDEHELQLFIAKSLANYSIHTVVEFLTGDDTGDPAAVDSLDVYQ